MKKSTLVISLLLALCMAFSVCACGDAEPATQATETPSQGEEIETAASGQDTATFEGPVLIVSVGKSADTTIAKSIFDRLGVEYKVYEGAAGETFDLTGIKTVMIVPGVSTKGLGEAGIKIDDELKMTTSLVEQINAADVKVIVAHLGGASRRDELTDQFIDVVLPAADKILALADANEDGKFSDFAVANDVDCQIAAAFADMVTSVQQMFGK